MVLKIRISLHQTMAALPSSINNDNIIAKMSLNVVIHGKCQQYSQLPGRQRFDAF